MMDKQKTLETICYFSISFTTEFQEAKPKTKPTIQDPETQKDL